MPEPALPSTVLGPLQLWQPQTELVAGLAAWRVPLAEAPLRVVLVLDGVEGPREASVLRVFLRPGGLRPSGARNHSAGSLSLYGLRQSNVRGSRQLRLDLTPTLRTAHPAGWQQLGRVVLVFHLRHALPVDRALTIRSVRLEAEQL